MIPDATEMIQDARMTIQDAPPDLVHEGQDSCCDRPNLVHSNNNLVSLRHGLIPAEIRINSDFAIQFSPELLPARKIDLATENSNGQQDREKAFHDQRALPDGPEAYLETKDVEL